MTQKKLADKAGQPFRVATKDVCRDVYNVCPRSVSSKMFAGVTLNTKGFPIIIAGNPFRKITPWRRRILNNVFFWGGERQVDFGNPLPVGTGDRKMVTCPAIWLDPIKILLFGVVCRQRTL